MDKILKVSGTDSVFVREFFEGKEDAQRHKIVPFRQDTDLAAASRQAAKIGHHCGIVKTFKGFALRVLSDQFEEAVHMVRPRDAAGFLGNKYEVSGLPQSCGEEAIRDLLSWWIGAVPISTFKTGRTRT